MFIVLFPITLSMARPDRVLLGVGLLLLGLHLALPLLPGFLAPPPQGEPSATAYAAGFPAQVAAIVSLWWLFLLAGVVLGGAIRRQPDLLWPRRPSFPREELLTALEPVLAIRHRGRIVRGMGLIGLGAALFFINLWLLPSPAIVMVAWLWAAVVPPVAVGVLLWFRRAPAARMTESRRLEMPSAAWPRLHLALRHAAESAGFRIQEEAVPDPRRRGGVPWTSPAAGVRAVRPASAPPHLSTGGLAAGGAGLGLLVHALLMQGLGVELPGPVVPLALALLLAALGLLLYAGVRHQRGELLVYEEAVLPQGAPATVHVTVGARATDRFDPEALKAGFEAVAKALREFSPTP